MPEQTYLTVNGKQLEVAWYDPGQNPTSSPAASSPVPQKTTLVFLHEGLGCMAMWRDFPARIALATGCRAFVFSRLGYGRSDPCPLPRPIRFMHDEGITVLPQILKTAGIGDYILIGHSDGGSISLIHAGGTKAPGLRGVITEAPHLFCEPVTIRSIQQAKSDYLHGDLCAGLEKYHGSNTDTAFWGWNDVWLHPDFAHWDITSYLTDIRVPVLAIQGEDDPYGTQAQIDTIVRMAGSPVKTVILPVCGHAPHREQKDATLAAMTRFIHRLTGND